jgi:toxin ParE1/3/4
MRLELSRAAEADLAGIRDYTVEHHGGDQAIAYLDAIEQAFRRIMDYPESGMKYPGIEPAIRSVPCGSHRIYYDAAGDAVRIQRVLHKAMDAEKWLGMHLSR